MHRLGPYLKRLAAVAAGVLVGLVTVVAVAGPARAEHTEVAGDCGWDAEAAEWVVTWTVTTDAPGPFQVLEVESLPAESPVDGISEGPHDAGDPLVGEQRLPAGATTASLGVRAAWDGHEDTTLRYGEVALPGDCAIPEPPTDLGQWTFDCHLLTITIDNETGDELVLTFAPSTGDPVDVEVGGGQSATVQFPSEAGVSVDVRFQGVSVVDPEQPIEITPAAWSELDCDDGEDGGGGGLPATGTPVALVAVGALFLLAVGGGLFLLARRRRIIFTA